MFKIFKIAIRNLRRYKRRSLLTLLLISFGVLMVIVFSGLSQSFKSMMISQITDSNLSQIQIHKKGYVTSIDTMPLNLNLKPKAYKKIQNVLDTHPDVEAYAPRIRLGAMLSNYSDTTNIRLNAVDPIQEIMVCPNVMDRIKSKNNQIPDVLIKPGEIIIPQKLAKGMKIEIGSVVVLIANNKDGSMNGLNFTVAAIIDTALGPQGKDGYIHIDDARSLLRLDGRNKMEITEIAIRTKRSDKLHSIYGDLKLKLSRFKNKKGKLAFEIHTWKDLSPFSNMARIIDIMQLAMKFIMTFIVLISVLNVMMMSIYERIREIGTMSAIGTTPARIMWIFLAEGISLGLISIIIGNIVGAIGIYTLNIFKIHFSFGRMESMLLAPSIRFTDLFWIDIIVIGVALIASLQPAYKASKMEPVEALGHV